MNEGSPRMYVDYTSISKKSSITEDHHLNHAIRRSRFIQGSSAKPNILICINNNNFNELTITLTKIKHVLIQQAHSSSTLKADPVRAKVSVKATTVDAHETRSLTSGQKSPLKHRKNPSKRKRIFNKIRGKKSKPTNDLHEQAKNENSENKPIVTVKSIYKKNPNAKKNNVCKTVDGNTEAKNELDALQKMHLVSHSEPSTSTEHPSIPVSKPTIQSGVNKVTTKATSEEETFAVKDKSSSVSGRFLDVSCVEPSPSVPSIKDGSKTQLCVTEGKVKENGQLVKHENCVIMENSVDKSKDESSPSSTVEFNPPHHSTLKQQPSSSDTASISEIPKSHHSPPHVKHRVRLDRPATPVPCVPLRNRPFHRPLQSVTFSPTPNILQMSSSDDNFEECFQSSNQSSSSSAAEHVSLKVKSKVLNSQQHKKIDGNISAAKAFKVQQLFI